MAASVKMIPQIGGEVATARQGSGGAFVPTGISSISASSCKPSHQDSAGHIILLLGNVGVQFWIVVGKEGPGHCPQQGGGAHQVETSVPTAGVYISVANSNSWWPGYIMWIATPKQKLTQNSSRKYTPLMTKMSDDESTKGEGENDANHPSHVSLRDETAPCSWRHPPGS